MDHLEETHSLSTHNHDFESEDHMVHHEHSTGAINGAHGTDFVHALISKLHLSPRIHHENSGHHQVEEHVEHHTTTDHAVHQVDNASADAKDLHHLVQHFVHLASLYDQHDAAIEQHNQAGEHGLYEEIIEEQTYLEEHIDDLEELIADAENHIDIGHEHHSHLVSSLEPLGKSQLLSVIQHLEKKHPHLAEQGVASDGHAHAEAILKELHLTHHHAPQAELAEAKEVHHIVSHLVHLSELYSTHEGVNEDLHGVLNEHADSPEHTAALAEEQQYLEAHLEELEELMAEIEDHVDSDSHHGHLLYHLEPLERSELTRVMEHLEKKHAAINPDVHDFHSEEHWAHHEGVGHNVHAGHEDHEHHGVEYVRELLKGLGVGLHHEEHEHHDSEVILHAPLDTEEPHHAVHQYFSDDHPVNSDATTGHGEHHEATHVYPYGSNTHHAPDVHRAVISHSLESKAYHTRPAMNYLTHDHHKSDIHAFVQKDTPKVAHAADHASSLKQHKVDSAVRSHARGENHNEYPMFLETKQTRTHHSRHTGLRPNHFSDHVAAKPTVEARRATLIN